jgi:hypothetical protein
MKTSTQQFVGLVAVLLLAAPVWSQVDARTQPVPAFGLDSSADSSDDRMLTPPPVSGQTYPTAPSSQERSNYLRGGVIFTTAHTDNALGSLSSSPISDMSYSVGPTVALDETTSRLHTILTYAPGFTAYQKTGSRNEADQNAAIDFEYRLSSHLTFSARDGFLKSSNVLNQSGLANGGTVSGATQGANFSVIAPLADRLSNAGNVGITDQFSLNQMIGASGTFTNLHYPNPQQVPGLFDASSQGGSAFYSLRISKMNYVGATYQYQRLLSYPTASVNETQTHAILFFYTLYTSPRFSVSFFGGPQHSDSVQNLSSGTTTVPAPRMWTPAAGASLSWQGRQNNFAASYSHSIAGGGGLIGAVQMDSASLSAGQQITKTLSGSLAGGYSQNNLLDTLLPAETYGHSIYGTVSLQQQFGQHVILQAGYTRLHQSYSNVAVLSTAPDTNREFISISYQFSKALGR